eukprot:m51a1_g3627 putative xylananse (429) ;mRNA; r:123247-127583
MADDMIRVRSMIVGQPLPAIPAEYRDQWDGRAAEIGALLAAGGAHRCVGRVDEPYNNDWTACGTVFLFGDSGWAITNSHVAAPDGDDGRPVCRVQDLRFVFFDADGKEFIIPPRRRIVIMTYFEGDDGGDLHERAPDLAFIQLGYTDQLTSMNYLPTADLEERKEEALELCRSANTMLHSVPLVPLAWLLGHEDEEDEEDEERKRLARISTTAASASLVLASLLVLATASPVLRVTCVGDSITEGYPWMDARAWPAVAQGLLGPGYALLNAGVGGTTAQLAGDYPWVRSRMYAAAMASSPDVVIVMLGTNDAKWFNWNEARFCADYTALIRSLVALPSRPQVLVAVPPPLYIDGVISMNGTVINEVLPRLVPRIAWAAGATPLTGGFSLLGGAALARPDLILDGCHPNAEGHTALAHYMADTIRMALA